MVCQWFLSTFVWTLESTGELLKTNTWAPPCGSDLVWGGNLVFVCFQISPGDLKSSSGFRSVFISQWSYWFICILPPYPSPPNMEQGTSVPSAWGLPTGHILGSFLSCFSPLLGCFCIEAVELDWTFLGHLPWWCVALGWDCCHQKRLLSFAPFSTVHSAGVGIPLEQGVVGKSKGKELKLNYHMLSTCIVLLFNINSDGVIPVSQRAQMVLSPVRRGPLLKNKFVMSGPLFLKWNPFSMLLLKKP